MNKKLTIREITQSALKKAEIKKYSDSEEQQGPPPLSMIEGVRNSGSDVWIGSINESFPQIISRIKQPQVQNNLREVVNRDLKQQKTNKTPIPQRKSIKIPSIQMIEKVLEKIPKEYYNPIQNFENNTAKQALIIILTNPNKLNQYIDYLVSRMPQLPSQTIKNYELLILLLKKVNQNEYQIEQNKSDFHIKFNHEIQQRKDTEILSIKQKLTQKEEELIKYTKQYQKIVDEMTQTIKQLIKKKNKLKRTSFVPEQQTLKKRAPTFSRIANYQ